MISKQVLDMNFEKLKNNSYPGRGIIIGMTPDSKNMVQVYWIMGRSENSRNRIFENDNGFVRTKAYDESKVTDPSLIIYYPAKYCGNKHIITNGDQTDTVYDALVAGKSFESALNTRGYEPDAPNLTPRISGLISLNDTQYIYRLSILKSFNNTEGLNIRNYYNYEKAVPGVGHCIHTYLHDGNPLPSFTGEPYEMELFNDINATAEFYWDALNKENRVSLLVKHISVEDGSYSVKIINRHNK